MFGFGMKKKRVTARLFQNINYKNLCKCCQVFSQISHSYDLEQKFQKSKTCAYLLLITVHVQLYMNTCLKVHLKGFGKD